MSDDDKQSNERPTQPSVRRPTPSTPMAALRQVTPVEGDPPLTDQERDFFIRKMVRRVERIDLEVDSIGTIARDHGATLKDIRADREVVASDLLSINKRLDAQNRKLNLIKDYLVKLLIHNGIQVPPAE